MKEIKEVEYNNSKTNYTDSVVCPYCYHESHIDAEDYTQSDNSQFYECGNCEKTFVYSSSYSVSQSTEPYENYYLRELDNLNRQLKSYEKHLKENPEDKEYCEKSISAYKRYIERLKKEASDILEIGE